MCVNSGVNLFGKELPSALAILRPLAKVTNKFVSHFGSSRLFELQSVFA